MEEKLDAMMEEFRDTKRELEQKFLSSLNQLKKEINAAQESTMRQFSKKISSSTYEFWRKGNEHQFNFNCGIEDTIDNAKSELSKVKAADNDSKEAVKRAESSLDEGAKALTIRQKHIKIADRSDLSWATIKHYMADPLADGPEDEKEIARSEKEALKKQERANAKKVPKRGGGGKSRKPRQDYHQRNPSYRYEPYNDFGKRKWFALPPPPMPQQQFRPLVLGPCFRCGAYGHIQSSCSTPA